MPNLQWERWRISKTLAMQIWAATMLVVGTDLHQNGLRTVINIQHANCVHLLIFWPICQNWL